MEKEVLRKLIIEDKKERFNALAMEVFELQVRENDIYKAFVDTLKGEKFTPNSICDIPFLPISFFKSHKVVSGNWEAKKVYKSSATTGMTRSNHYVFDDAFYLSEALVTFESFYGSMNDICLLALLPCYLERGDSSLVSMADCFIKQSEYSGSGFFLDNIEALESSIAKARLDHKKIVLLGVSFALLELSEKGWDLSDVVIMETGGMKGRGPEMPKAAFHDLLKKRFNTAKIHSEYGMTELLSQAYSIGDGIFQSSKTMEIRITELTDPLCFQEDGKGGVINVIDLMNLDSRSFVCTEDMGIRYADGSFKILGRVDAAEIRGCNLLVSDL